MLVAPGAIDHDRATRVVQSPAVAAASTPGGGSFIAAWQPVATSRAARHRFITPPDYRNGRSVAPKISFAGVRGTVRAPCDRMRDARIERVVGRSVVVLEIVTIAILVVLVV